ncbi:MAG: TonB-dependent receptor [Acidobacteria bacterium]|nr:TonB-dependent receptor [Acidobacteriota bacterium]
MAVTARTILLIFAALFSAEGMFAQTRGINVIVNDEAGSRIHNATVRIVIPNGPALECDLAEELFVCPETDEYPFVLEVRAEGFAPFRRAFSRPETISPISVTLKVGTFDIAHPAIIVGRIENRAGDTPESIAVITRSDITSSAAPTLDDALRQIAGFSIFRRSGSRTANPTTQGVSLRGLGGSGASRTAVIFDGVMLNDPFGGWVQWNRIPPIAVERVEVLRGGASSLYGNSSLGGAVQIVPRSVERKHIFSAEVFGGSERTLSSSVYTGRAFGQWTADASAYAFRTKGHIPVDKTERGEMDTHAGVRAFSFSSRITGRVGNTAHFFARPSYFAESRKNGTPLQTNDTHSRQLIVGGSFSPAIKQGNSPQLSVNWSIHGGSQVYDQVFTSVNASRTAETLTRLQRSPAQTLGFSVGASAAFTNHTLLAGAEGRNIRGASDEIGFSAGNPSGLFGSGGREASFGFFVKDQAFVGKRVVITGSVRYDRWNNHRGLSATRPINEAAISVTHYPDRIESMTSPQISLLFRVNDTVSVYGSASRSFRAPTLNELYRGFRVGNVVTNANENLRAERANNIETGISFAGSRYFLRVNGYLTEIDGAVSNVTISSAPALIVRQRQNAGRTRTKGIEADLETRLGPLSFNFGYLFADPSLKSFPSNTELVGKMIPQVARHQATMQISYHAGRWNVAGQIRLSSEQFDDDLNAFRLEPYGQADIMIGRKMGDSGRMFIAVENVFNSRYSVGRTPIRTVSSPINFRLGYRFDRKK